MWMGNQNTMGVSETTPPVSAQAVDMNASSIEVETRFGKATIYPARAIQFRNGLLGFEGLDRFCLTEFPMQRMQHFKLLQSLDDKDLSFITLPLAIHNDFIAAEDVLDAAKSLSIPTEHLAVLLIVSVHRRVNVVNLSVNARAPLLVDVDRKVAYQHVFANNRYDIRHPVSYADGTSAKAAVPSAS